MTPRVVVLGLDGATLDLISPWAAAGALPTFAALLQGGASGRLRSTSPPITPVAWPTIYTGTNAGKHGVIGFEKRVPGEYRWTKSSALDLRRRPLWELLAEEEMRSAAFFAPYTFPARPIEGWIVAGRGAPSGITEGRSAPEGLASDLARRFGEIDLFGARRPPGHKLGDIAGALVRSIESQTDALLWTLQQESFDFVFTVWDQTDTAGHLLWHHTDVPCPDVGSPMHGVYAAIDRSFERVLDTVSDDTLVVVCSDHGCYPIEHRARVPLWLEREGFLARRTTAGSRVLSAAGNVWLRLPEGVRRALPRAATKRVGAKHEETFRQNTLVDWTSTRVYPQPVSAEAFYLNLAGREPSGAVAPDEAEGVLAELAAALLAMQTPAGRSLVRATVRGDDAFRGPHRGSAPDLVAELERGVYFSPTPAGELFDSPARPSMDDPPRSLGYHDPDGVLLLHGPRVEGGTVEGARVEDVMPTILRYLDVAIPEDVDGSPLVTAFTTSPAPRSRPPEGETVQSGELRPEEEADIERQLKDLGYIE